MILTNSIYLKNIIDEDFIQYKKPSLFIGVAGCDFKCAREGGFSPSLCQNFELEKSNTILFSLDSLAKRYLSNPITSAIVFGGMEPLNQFNEIKSFIQYLREVKKCEDDIVIYTGYKIEEVVEYIEELCPFNNIIVKFGRFVPNQECHYDEILGVNLISPNQYAKKIS